jgi:Ribbon-helix-helix protein, copG family
MSEPPIHGHTKLGRAVTDEDIEKLAAEAEAGYDVDTLIARRNKRGRPTIGSSAASVESVRLDPELRRQLIERAQSEGTTPSELIREALRRYLHAT